MGTTEVLRRLATAPEAVSQTCTADGQAESSCPERRTDVRQLGPNACTLETPVFAVEFLFNGAIHQPGYLAMSWSHSVRHPASCM